MNKKPFFILMAILLYSYGIYYIVHETLWVDMMTFLDPKGWNNSPWADATAVIPTAWRAMYLVLWLSPVMFGGASIFTSVWICVIARNGEYFQMRIAHGLIRAGLFSATSAALAIFAGSISPMLVSWYNAAGPLPLRFWTGQNPAILVSGLVIAFLGWVLRDAVALAAENREFV